MSASKDKAVRKKARGEAKQYVQNLLNNMNLRERWLFVFTKDYWKAMARTEQRIYKRKDVIGRGKAIVQEQEDGTYRGNVYIYKSKKDKVIKKKNLQQMLSFCHKKHFDISMAPSKKNVEKYNNLSKEDVEIIDKTYDKINNDMEAGKMPGGEK